MDSPIYQIVISSGTEYETVFGKWVLVIRNGELVDSFPVWRHPSNPLAVQGQEAVSALASVAGLASRAENKELRAQATNFGKQISRDNGAAIASFVDGLVSEVPLTKTGT